jgi:hypothetical protein
MAAALAWAGPALATDEPSPASIALPPSEMPADAQPSPTTSDPLSIPAPPAIPSLPELEADVAPISVEVTEGETGSVNVSVRVLSPGEGEPPPEQDAESKVIPPAPGSDITGEGTSSPPNADDGADDAPAAGSNVNVSVRVLSPGDDGPVVQSAEQDGDIDALTPTAATPDPPPVDTGLPFPPSEVTADSSGDSNGEAANSERYHDDDSRYQSERQSERATWYWSWELTVDCAGNASAESEETGAQSSLDWVWEWTWEWSCGSLPRPPPVEADLPRAPAEAPASGSTVSDGGRASKNDTSEDAPGTEPWIWSWTFTFCGETVASRIPISSVRTELQWQWDWTWDWSCDVSTPAPEPTSTTSEDLSPSPSVQAPGEDTLPAAGEATGVDVTVAMPIPDWLVAIQVPGWLISRLQPTELRPALPPGLGPLGDTFSASAIAVGVEIGAPFAPHVDSGLGQPKAERDRTIPPPALTSPSVELVRPTTPMGREHEQSSSAGQSHATRADSTAPRDPGSLRPIGKRSGSGHKRRAPLSPFGLPSLPGSGLSGSSSSFAPSGMVLGTAALVALFVLAAPTLVRRIRVPRELSPRGTHASSIDHPG